MVGKDLILFIFVVAWTCDRTYSKIHHLTFSDEKRPFIHLLDFGFLPGGYLQIELTNFTLLQTKSLIGFTLNKGYEVNDYLKMPNDGCVLKSRDVDETVYFSFNLQSKSIDVFRNGDDVVYLDVCYGAAEEDLSAKCLDFAENATSTRPKVDREKRDNDTDDESEKKNKSSNEKQKKKSSSSEVSTSRKTIPLETTFSTNEFNTIFTIRFWQKEHEGPYYFFFHNCYNFGKNVHEQVGVSFKINMVAKNEHSFLSSGDIPNPHLYLGYAVLFFMTGIVWVYLIKTTKDPVYKIHMLMAVLIFLKSLSLLFHGINYYFISMYGHQRELWAIVYYIMHLLKGMLLFGVIILIGTGWTFFKNFLTDRDRKLFMVIIPLQVLDNIALIIVEESEIGQKSDSTWSKLFILVDLICCAAIILPVIWSIRHLQEASQTDGKAAFNLKKLKLFRQFYILVICYIYLTRIVKYLIVFSVPFKYNYVVVVVVELATWFFYVLTGYKFKPASNNPYLKFEMNDSDNEELEDIVMQSGALEGIVRVNRAAVDKQQNVKRDDDEDEETLFVNKEISHDLD